MPDPILTLAGDRLVRRHGWFWRRGLALGEVERIVAVSSDAVTHEATHVVLQAGTRTLAISEFDTGFPEVFAALRSRFPGMAGLEDVVAATPFAPLRRVLWPRATD